jgi:demethylmenaquinone methyltransferase/2-methoxy-6-polyprenyl-1,4-benzoquinol methylase
MSPRYPKGYWYLPGLLYDLAFKRMFRGLRRRVARTIEREGLYPWLDICCGTGDQLRGHLRGHVPVVRVPGLGSDDAVYGLDLSFGFVRYARARAPQVPFICGDAARLPFKDRSLRAVSVSFALHDKSLELRSAILASARRVLRPDGRLIAVDFENPWDSASRAGALFTRAIERFAGRAHYDNGRDFLRRGGLRGFLRENGFVEVARRDIPAGSVSVVVARVDTDSPCDLPPAE